MVTSQSVVPQRGPLLHWMIFTGLCAFGAALLWHFGLLQLMIAADRTRISLVIAALYLGASLHCFNRMRIIAREADAARLAASLVRNGGPLLIEGAREGLPQGLVATHMRDLATKAREPDAGPLDQTLLLRVFAGHLRGPNGFGGFASDLSMKLGLVGTIIGFIIMLAPIAALDPADRGALRASMGTMTAGMAIAMYTTLAGLVGSILIKIQYSLLDAATAHLFTIVVGLVEIQSSARRSPAE